MTDHNHDLPRLPDESLDTQLHNVKALDSSLVYTITDHRERHIADLMQQVETLNTQLDAHRAKSEAWDALCDLLSIDRHGVFGSFGYSDGLHTFEFRMPTLYDATFRASAPSRESAMRQVYAKFMSTHRAHQSRQQKG